MSTVFLFLCIIFCLKCIFIHITIKFLPFYAQIIVFMHFYLQQRERITSKEGELKIQKDMP